MLELRNKIFLGFFLAIFLFIVNFVAIKFSWYYFFSELDIFSHLLGGFLIFILLQILFENLKFKSNFKILLIFMLSVTIFWEFAELLFKTRSEINLLYFFDSVSDIFFGISGGTLAYLLIFKK